MYLLATRLAIATLFGIHVAANAAETRRVSLDSYGGDSNGHSHAPAISDSGSIIAFVSTASDLTFQPDNNGTFDVFVREGFVTTRVSLDIYGEDPNGPSLAPAISGDGRFIAFQSAATTLIKVDSNGVDDIFVCDRFAAVIERVSLTAAGAQSNGASYAPAISGDGRFVTFFTAAALVPEDTNGLPDVYRRDLVTDTTLRVSVATNGAQGNGFSNFSAISTNGRFVAFQSTSSNLVTGDTNGAFDIFVRDITKGTTERVSVDGFGAQYAAASNFPSISGNGRFVTFESGNTVTQVSVRDRKKGKTHLVSRNEAGVPGNSSSGAAKISRDGKRVTFRTHANNLLPTDPDFQSDVVVCKRTGKQMTLVSHASSGMSAGGSSDLPAIDANASSIAFQSDGEDLVKGDKNSVQDVFVRDT